MKFRLALAFAIIPISGSFVWFVLRDQGPIDLGPTHKVVWQGFEIELPIDATSDHRPVLGTDKGTGGVIGKTWVVIVDGSPERIGLRLRRVRATSKLDASQQAYVDAADSVAALQADLIMQSKLQADQSSKQQDQADVEPVNVNGLSMGRTVLKNEGERGDWWARLYTHRASDKLELMVTFTCDERPSSRRFRTLDALCQTVRQVPGANAQADELQPPIGENVADMRLVEFPGTGEQLDEICRLVMSLTESTLSGDADAVIARTDPRVLKALGGESEMRATIARGQEQDSKLVTMTFPDPPKYFRTVLNEYVIVPSIAVVEVSGREATVYAEQIGNRKIGSDRWYFCELGDQVELLFPELAPSLQRLRPRLR